MKKTVLFWILAFVITAVTAYYQRVTGPTYPLSGKAALNGAEIKYKLERSHVTSSDAPVTVAVPGSSFSGILEWKRYKTSDSWTNIPMQYKNGNLAASLPHQPAAGKLEYRVLLENNNQTALLPKDQNVVIRFKGDVPIFILIPHVIAMFGAMMLSTRTGLEFFNKTPNLKRLTIWTLGFLFVGGMILGPLTQLYAFNALWTGYPFGTDLTDNKTLIALLGWIAAAVAIFRSKRPRLSALIAAVILLVVYMIPHSMFGSELDYNKIDGQKNRIETSRK